jgi:methylmalonyl-CoA mutase cobalamin-binding domain/chain
VIDLDSFKEAVGNLEEDAVQKMLSIFIAENPDIEQTQEVVSACQQGMDIVGANYEKGKYYAGDLVFAGELLTSCVDRLKPLLCVGENNLRGVIVLGTVEGDIHDIGKNIFHKMIESAGFKVIDIGIDQEPDAFVEAVRESGAAIVGLSGLLTRSIESMKRTVDALKKAGLGAVKVFIGGYPVGAEACEYVGADAWSRNAADAVRICIEWVS